MDEPKFDHFLVAVDVLDILIRSADVDRVVGVRLSD